MQREGEVGDELGARDDEGEEDDAGGGGPRGGWVSGCGMYVCMYVREGGREGGREEGRGMREDDSVRGSTLSMLGRDGPPQAFSVEKRLGVSLHVKEKQKTEQNTPTHPHRLAPSQHTPSVHPPAVSPRRPRQPSTRSGEKGRPAVRAAKSSRPVTQR